MAEEPGKLDISDEMIAERRGLNLLLILINLVSGLAILFVGY
jgi:hypothetical protein